MKRRLAISVAAVALTVAPGVAQAAGISTSRLDFTTNASGRINDHDRWRGPSTGHARVCGDVVGSSTGIGNDMDIYRDVSFAPDPAVTYATLWYSHPYACGSLAATSSNSYYYTAHYRVRETSPHSGYVDARDS